MVACSDFGEEAPPPSSEAGAEAAAIDGAKPDPPTDADLDGGGLLEASREGGPSPCIAAHAFCDDFDKKLAGDIPDWSLGSQVDPGSALTLRVDTLARSVPNVLQADAPPQKTAMITQQIDTARGVTCSFSTRVTSSGAPTPRPSFAFLELDGNSVDAYQVDLRLDSITVKGTLPDGGAAQGTTKTLLATPPGQWKRVTIAMEFGPSGNVKVAFDGVVQLSFAGSLAAIQVATRARLKLGLVSRSTVGTTTAQFDDVVCDLIE